MRGKDDCILVVYNVTDIFYAQLVPWVELVIRLVLYKKSFRNTKEVEMQ